MTLQEIKSILSNKFFYRLNEAKFNFSCKFALAIDLIEKIAEEKITLEKLLNKE